MPSGSTSRRSGRVDHTDVERGRRRIGSILWLELDAQHQPEPAVTLSNTARTQLAHELDQIANRASRGRLYALSHRPSDDPPSYVAPRATTLDAVPQHPAQEPERLEGGQSCHGSGASRVAKRARAPTNA